MRQLQSLDRLRYFHIHYWMLNFQAPQAQNLLKQVTMLTMEQAPHNLRIRMKKLVSFVKITPEFLIKKV